MNNILRVLSFMVFGAFLVMGYQNCGQGLKLNASAVGASKPLHTRIDIITEVNEQLEENGQELDSITDEVKEEIIEEIEENGGNDELAEEVLEDPYYCQVGETRSLDQQGQPFLAAATLPNANDSRALAGYAFHVKDLTIPIQIRVYKGSNLLLEDRTQYESLSPGSAHKTMFWITSLQLYQAGLEAQTDHHLTVKAVNPFDCSEKEIPNSFAVNYRGVSAIPDNCTDHGEQIALADILNMTNTPQKIKVSCNGNGKVTAIYASSANLIGDLPQSIFRLTSLTRLEMGYNKITSLPTGYLKDLVSLENLYLQNNDLTDVSPDIGSLTNLKSLYIQGNPYSDLPAEFWNLVNLESLHINAVNVPGGVGSFTKLKNLHLYGQERRVTPFLASQLGSLPLESLAFDNVGYTSMPEWIFDIKSLKHIRFEVSDLETIGERFGELTNLETIYIPRNNLKALPNSIGQLTKLKKLWVLDNDLTAIPLSIGNLVNLEDFYVGGNQIQVFPEVLSNLKELKTLSISQNSVTQFPPLSLPKLERLYMKYLFLTDFPSGVEFPALKKLGLDYIPFEEFPKAVLNLTNLESLSYTGNELEEIPLEISNLVNLKTLNFWSNNIREIPSGTLDQLVNLETLTLSYNELSSFPNLQGLTNLYSLGLKSNNLTGEVPEWVFGLSNLTYLGLAYNQLTGIPNQFDKLPKLRSLELTQNNFSGEIPDSIRYLVDLNHLYLQENNFSGPFPEWLGTMTKLVTLQLQDNQLSGPIPSSFTQISPANCSIGGNPGLGPFSPEVERICEVSGFGGYGY